MYFRKRFLIIYCFFVFYSVSLKAQSYNNLNGQSSDINTIATAVPFLMIGPDARSAGLGNSGIASSPDANSLYWNPAKYGFLNNYGGFTISVLPFRINDKQAPNKCFNYESFFVRLSKKLILGSSFRLLSSDEIQFTDQNGQSLGYFKPTDFAFDVTLAGMINKRLSLAITTRYINSNLTAGQNVQGVETTTGRSFAIDLSLYWKKRFSPLI